MSNYVVSDTTLTSIANAIRTKGGTSASLTFPQGFVDAIGEISGGGEDEPWVRPSDWPDIDALAAQIEGDQDCLYLTYDLRKTPGYGWIGLYAKTDDSSAWTVERGRVDAGAFVADETFNTASNDYFRQALDDTDDEVQLWRVSSTGQITNFGFATNTATDASNLDCRAQPCVDRAGTLPWCVRWAGSGGKSYNALSGVTYWMEHDHLIPGKNAVVTDLSHCWRNAYRLKVLDLSGWNTSAWQVGYLNNCWENAIALKKIEPSSWDTSGWHVVYMNYLVQGCRSLQKADFTSWDTSGWKVVQCNGAFSNTGEALIDISTWNTSGWNVTSTTNFAYNGLIRELKLPATLGIPESATSLTRFLDAQPCLTFFSGTSLHASFSLSSSELLTRESLLSVIDRLGEVESTRTITLGQVNKNKLTAEEIAIATAKGWTVA